MLIRVLLDVKEHLKRRKKIRMENGAWAMISFKYERLGTLCFLCGKLGHSDRLCPLQFRARGEVWEWGLGQKAPVRRARASGGSDGYGRKEGRSRRIRILEVS